MSRRWFTPLSWLTIDYSPHPEELSFLERAQTLREREVETTVAVPSDRESELVFGVRLARHGLQAVWLEVANGGEEPLWLDRYSPRSILNHPRNWRRGHSAAILASASVTAMFCTSSGGKSCRAWR
jgi:hypothetical protein